jgi:hypothetical protein
MDLDNLHVKSILKKIEKDIQNIWDGILNEPVVVFRLSVPNKEVAFPSGCGSKPFCALEAARRLTDQCDKSGTIQEIVVAKRNYYVC